MINQQTKEIQPEVLNRYSTNFLPIQKLQLNQENENYIIVKNEYGYKFTLCKEILDLNRIIYKSGTFDLSSSLFKDFIEKQLIIDKKNILDQLDNNINNNAKLVFDAKWIFEDSLNYFEYIHFPMLKSFMPWDNAHIYSLGSLLETWNNTKELTFTNNGTGDEVYLINIRRGLNSKVNLKVFNKSKNKIEEIDQTFSKIDPDFNPERVFECFRNIRNTNLEKLDLGFILIKEFLVNISA